MEKALKPFSLCRYAKNFRGKPFFVQETVCKDYLTTEPC